jgi:hypothetical protein
MKYAVTTVLRRMNTQTDKHDDSVSFLSLKQGNEEGCRCIGKCGAASYQQERTTISSLPLETCDNDERILR